MDTQGLLLGVTVTAANISDREGGKVLLRQVHLSQPQWSLHLFVDGNCSAGQAQGLKLGMSTSPVNTLTKPSQTLRPCFCNVEM